MSNEIGSTNSDIHYVSQVLQKEIDSLEEKLVNVNSIDEKSELIGKMNLLKFSQELLGRCNEFDVIPRAIWRRVPYPEGHYSELRLMDDRESEDRTIWKEIDFMRLNGGEVIIG